MAVKLKKERGDRRGRYGGFELISSGAYALSYVAESPHGRRCEACEGTEFRDECVRCRGACVDVRDGGRRSYAALAVFRATGRIAFPERVGGPSKTPPAKPAVRPSARPAAPPIPAVPAGPVGDDIWSRAGWCLGIVAGTAVGLCRRWLDGLGIK